MFEFGNREIRDMSIFNRLFRESKTWNIRSINELAETHRVPSQLLPWKIETPSYLTVGNNYIGVVVKKNVIHLLNSGGTIKASFHRHEKKITELALDKQGKWMASAEEEGSFFYVGAIKDSNQFIRVETATPVTTLAFGSGVIYAGLKSGTVEVFSWDGKTSGKSKQFEFATKLFDEPQGVSCIDVSPDGEKVALIIGGFLFLWDRHTEEAVTEITSDTCRMMSTRFSPDGRYLVGVGGRFSASISLGQQENQFHFKDVRGILSLRHLESDKKIVLRGEGFWIPNVFWSSNSDRILCLPSVAPQENGRWTKAISYHSLEALLNESLRPESVTPISTSVDTGSGGIIAPGKLVMTIGEGGGIGSWDVGEEFYIRKSVKEEIPVLQPTMENKEPVPSLEAIVVVFNRKFPTIHQFVDEILDQLTTRGKTYRYWMRDDTPVKIKIHPKSQEQYSVSALAVVEFHKLLGDHVDLCNVQFGTFEGSQDVVGSIMSYWA